MNIYTEKCIIIPLKQLCFEEDMHLFALLDVIDYMLKTIDVSNIITLILLDIQKVFNISFISRYLLDNYQTDKL